MNFIGSILTDFYNAASSGNVSVKLSRKMDGALFSLGSLSNILMKKVSNLLVLIFHKLVSTLIHIGL